MQKPRMPRRAACWLLALVVLASGSHRMAAAGCPPLQVLAVGDSLTNGAVPSLNANHPYTLRLAQLLQQATGRQVSTTTVGECTRVVRSNPPRLNPKP